MQQTGHKGETSIFAQAKIDIASMHVNFRLGEIRHGVRACRFSPRRKLTCIEAMSIFAWAKIDVPSDIQSAA